MQHSTGNAIRGRRCFLDVSVHMYKWVCMFAVSAPDKTFLGSNHDHEVCTLAWHDMI